MKIFTVRIGERYGAEYEVYLKDKLKDYDLTFIREPIKPGIQLQWNKMYPMSLDIDEPVCVIDIDILLVNNYKELFDYPIERGQFLTIPAWWHDGAIPINGGFYKYYPKDCYHIYETFIEDFNYWQLNYIKQGVVFGPVNGEQNFVWEQIQQFDIVTIPPQWVTKWGNKVDKFDLHTRYVELTYNDYLYLDDFHPDIKLIHYTLEDVEHERRSL